MNLIPYAGTNHVLFVLFEKNDYIKNEKGGNVWIKNNELPS
ncbi:hypothetical protein ABEV55_15060 [Aneurinibacillus thermoaerophilus]|nr:hypothetical protein [Aneurinibacillus thermoaerophilus]